MSLFQNETKETDLIPDNIVDAFKNKFYKKGKFLGRGGFAKCYEFTDAKSKQIFAGKIVSKKLLTNSSHTYQLAQEIDIHKVVHHKNIVKFYSFFEDNQNVYIILELCRQRVSCCLLFFVFCV